MYLTKIGLNRPPSIPSTFYSLVTLPHLLSIFIKSSFILLEACPFVSFGLEDELPIFQLTKRELVSEWPGRSKYRRVVKLGAEHAYCVQPTSQYVFLLFSNVLVLEITTFPHLARDLRIFA